MLTTQEGDEELLLFLDTRRLEKGHQASLLMGPDHCKSSTTTMSSQRNPLRRTAADSFLYSENDKSDYDWLVTPPASPTKSLMNHLDAPDANPIALKSLLEKCREEKRDNTSSENQPLALNRPSSSNSSRPTSRPSTPARRSATPTSRATSTAARVTSAAARATLTSSSSTSSSRSTSRHSTPAPRPSSSGTSCANLTTARATDLTAQQTTSTRSNIRPMTVPYTKPGSRSTTPTPRRPPTPTGSSTALRSKPTKPSYKPAPSPTLRSRPWEPYEMPGFSLEAPSNLRTTLPDRPQTASSRRTVAFGTSRPRSASIERAVPRRQSCSPSRNRAPIGNANGARAKTNNDDGGLISPVAMGSQTVERVVNMRNFAPPRLRENGGRGGGGGGSTAGKSISGSDGVGFGRNLTKSSIDVPLRHMDVKRGSMKGNFRPQVTKAPAASLYSVRSSGTRRKRPVSSSGSSDSSVNILCLDGSDDNLSDISYS